MRVAESTTRGSFTLGSTNKRKSESAVSEGQSRLLPVKEEDNDKEVPINKTKNDDESSEGEVLDQTM